MFWAVFKESKDCATSVKWTGRAFQTDGAAWRKARLAKLVLATSTWRRFVEFDRSDLDAVWKLSRSERYSGFFMVTGLYVCKATLNRILDAIGSQCRIVENRVTIVTDHRASHCPCSFVVNAPLDMTHTIMWKWAALHTLSTWLLRDKVSYNHICHWEKHH